MKWDGCLGYDVSTGCLRERIEDIWCTGDVTMMWMCSLGRQPD